MSIFTGSAVAIVTPFNADGSVNYDVYKELVDFQIQNGTDAIVSCGTTGESATLSDEEQFNLHKLTVEVCAGKVPVIAGAGSNNTAHAAHLAKAAKDAGVSAVLAVTPYYNKATQNGLLIHFEEIAKACGLPVIVYSVPGRTAVNIEPATCVALTKIPGIVAIKEASGNIAQVAEIAALCADKMDIYSGNDDSIVPLLSLGGKGVISVLANVAPKQTHDMVAKYLEGDTAGSLKLQLEAMGLVKALFCELSPIPVKTALNLMGFKIGGFRSPLCEISPKANEFLVAEMKAYGLI